MGKKKPKPKKQPKPKDGDPNNLDGPGSPPTNPPGSGTR